MKTFNRVFAAGCLATSALLLPTFLGGCDREISHTSQTKVNSDGSSKTQETVIKQSPDGTVTKDQSKSTTPPAPNP